MIKLALLALLTALAAPVIAARTFEIQNDEFMRDGEVFRIKAGCIHYSRVPHEYWEDRLLRLKAMGLNAIQTYVPWNWHVANRNEPDFSSPDRNITHFIITAQKVGLVVVLRAGPYMCGEWEYGGLPAWINQNGTIKLRTYAEPYISFVKEYWGDQLMPVIKPLLYSNGGPVVMVQVENEYGSYGNVDSNPADKQYMEALVGVAETSLGNGSVILFTTDGGDTGYMSRGALKGTNVYTVGDGCGNPQTCIDAQKEFNLPGKSPFMCSECYTGWLTHWGEGGANSSSSAPHTDAILNLNGSISLYMGHGGTNWGFWSGANGGGGSSFQPHETSYDYDSPVSEAGEHGYHSNVDKYLAMQSVLLKHQTKADGPVPPEPALLPRTGYGDVKMTSAARVLDNLDVLGPTVQSTAAVTPPRMEALGCFYGSIMYTASLPKAAAGSTLGFGGAVQDRVQVFVGGEFQGTSYRVTGSAPVNVTGKAGDKIQLLVENMGRINFGHGMDNEHKGVKNVTLDGVAVTNWESRCLPLTGDTVVKVASLPVSASPGPATIFAGTLTVAGTPADTFLLMDGWAKGNVWVNGFNVGRYWQTMGPQRTLYIPGIKLVSGANDIRVLELDTASATMRIEFVGEPVLQSPPKPPPPARCDPTLKATAGAAVRMVTINPKLAHQQQWTMAASGEIQLKSDPTLCLTVEPGCPHAVSGCMIVDKCVDQSGQSAQQMFVWRPDPTVAGAHNLVLKSTGTCLDIYGHATEEGGPIDLYECINLATENNQRWKLDAGLGHLASFQAGAYPGDFLISVCTASE